LQSCCASGDAGMNGEEKFLIDVVLVGLIVVLVWTRFHRQNGRNGR
jgi:hypothetical protein